MKFHALMNKLLSLLIFLSTTSIALAQTFIVEPYLQDASPHSITIMWETNSGTESVVNWGETATELVNSATGTTSATDAGSVMHEVEITGLERFTPYFYSIQSNNLNSEVQRFKTPPFASDNEDFRFVAMSDMQQSGNDPYVYDEIIHDGVLDYISENFSGVSSEDLALVLIPGDLVVTGTNYGQWEDQFFTPSTDLFGEVPVYPVLGNHEINTPYYFQYFKLPENGSPGYEEHWWWKDYGNVRFVGLDSNPPFDVIEQLTWLEGVLDDVASSDSIDFVFAQLHHPHKSELWTPGESDFTGEVIMRLENFTEESGKPSVHFFGHTHGYSRGQSRDHKHLWINVATAGGAIDYWGEWPQFDYEEFQVSTDDWGFVVVDVEAGDNPSFSVKRFSRGDNYVDLDNELTDQITITLNEYLINTPTPLYPVDITVAPECVILSASDFETEGMHGESHWQVSESMDFNELTAEVYERFENIYFDEDTQAGESLTDEHVSGIDANNTYYWRVRYRDKELNWSDWSEPAEFNTGESSFSDNLLVNPGSEDELTGWVIDEGICESVTDGECDGTSPFEGARYFAVGGLCNESTVGRMHQLIDVSMHSDSIDLGSMMINYGAMMSDWSGDDVPEMKLIFLTQGGITIDETEYIAGPFVNWTEVSNTINIPALTRQIKCELKGTRNAGTDNDSYFDNVFVQVGYEAECNTDIVNITEPEFAKINAYPTPAIDSTTLSANGIREVRLTDLNGKKIDTEITYTNKGATIHRGALSQGVYCATIITRTGNFTSKIIFE